MYIVRVLLMFVFSGAWKPRRRFSIQGVVLCQTLQPHHSPCQESLRDFPRSARACISKDRTIGCIITMSLAVPY